MANDETVLVTSGRSKGVVEKGVERVGSEGW